MRIVDFTQNDVTWWPDVSYTINEDYSVQEAVEATYRLPGGCRRVRVRRGGDLMQLNLWDLTATSLENFRGDLYDRIEDGDEVEMEVNALCPGGPNGWVSGGRAAVDELVCDAESEPAPGPPGARLVRDLLRELRELESSQLGEGITEDKRRNHKRTVVVGGT